MFRHAARLNQRLYSARRPMLAPLVLLLCLWGRVAVAQAPASAGVEGEIMTAAVELDGRVLFRVRGVSSLPAPDRAELIRAQLVSAASDRTIPVESLRIVDRDGVSGILAGDTLIVAVVEADARFEQADRGDLARAHLYRIREAVTSYRAARSAQARARNVGAGIVATLVLAVVVVGMSRLWRITDRHLAARTRLPTAGGQTRELIRADRIWAAVRRLLAAARTALLLVITLLYLGFVLAQFPETGGLSRSLVQLVVSPLEMIRSAIVRSIPNVAFLIVLFFVVRLVLGLIQMFFEAIERGAVTFATFEPDWAQPTYRIVRVVLVAFGLVVAFPYIPGSDTAAFRGITIFFGLLFSIGSSSAIANIVAGYLLIYRRAFKIGDRIKIGGCVGDVIETRLQVTHLRSLKNEELIVPNSQILASDVLNYSSLARSRGLILHTEVAIGYDTSWRQVETLLVTAAERTADLGAEPRPFVHEKRLGEFAVTYELNVYCKNVQAMTALYAALHRNILDVFNEHGVQIMTPAYESDPAAPKIARAREWSVPPPLPGAAST